MRYLRVLRTAPPPSRGSVSVNRGALQGGTTKLKLSHDPARNDMAELLVLLGKATAMVAEILVREQDRELGPDARSIAASHASLDQVERAS